MRKKKNLPSRFKRVAELVFREPADFKAVLTEASAREIEIGCGKGGFTTHLAAANPEIQLVALEREDNALITAIESAVALNLKNIIFISADAKRLLEFFEPHTLSKIYINFCDPWDGNKHADRRLTAPGFLELYKQILSPEGELLFKTDNIDLFNYSIKSLRSCGWTLNNHFASYLTDYERKFIEQGKEIYKIGATL
jgi:tRNA (guanine-N7-)-methyltransferase